MNRNFVAQNSTRSRILDAAESVFVDMGYDGARVEEIAKRAQINKSQLFYYFGSKENILKELVKMHINEAEEIIRNTFNQNTIKDKQSFENLIDALIDFFKQKENIIKITLIEMLKNSSNDFSFFELFTPLYNTIKDKVLGFGGEIQDSDASNLDFFYHDIIPIALFVVSADKFAEFYKITDKEVQSKFYEMYKQTQLKYFERLQKIINNKI